MLRHGKVSATGPNMREFYHCTKPCAYAQLAEVSLEPKCDECTMSDDHPIKKHLALCKSHGAYKPTTLAARHCG